MVHDHYSNKCLSCVTFLHTAPPGPPSSLKATKVGPDYISLEWKPPSENGGSKITGYKVEQCEEDGENWIKVAEIPSFDTSYKVTGLKDTKAYLFAISAKNSIGYGPACETDKGIKPKTPEGIFYSLILHNYFIIKECTFLFWYGS